MVAKLSKYNISFILLVLTLFVIIAVLATSLCIAATLVTESNHTVLSGGGDPNEMLYLGAGLAVGLACIGAGYALGHATKAGFAAIIEKPELRGFVLIMAGLAEGIAIYGLLIAIIMLMMRH